MNDTPKTIDAHGAAEILGCSTDHVYQLASAGILPGAKIGKQWRFLPDDVITWFREEVERQVQERQQPGPVTKQKTHNYPDLPELPREITAP